MDWNENRNGGLFYQIKIKFLSLLFLFFSSPSPPSLLSSPPPPSLSYETSFQMGKLNSSKQLRQ